KLFSSWTKAAVPKKNIGTVAHRGQSMVYLLDRPGAVQSVILAGHVAPPKANPKEIAIETMNTALGGMFTSRINMNLREDKHWSYGVQSVLVGARGQRPFIVLAPVQTDKTKESMVEVAKELRDVIGPRPIAADELGKAQDNLTLRLPGSQETMNALASSIGNIVRYGLPDDYYETYPEKVRALTTTDVQEAARSVVRPDNLIWIVVGDRSKIEAGIRELGFGEIRYIDADGNEVS
ncbi:MAG: M16 family metallopeptidase, partial [Candidatus Methylomirabilia bacterium]